MQSPRQHGLGRRGARLRRSEFNVTLLTEIPSRQEKWQRIFRHFQDMRRLADGGPALASGLIAIVGLAVPEEIDGHKSSFP